MENKFKAIEPFTEKDLLSSFLQGTFTGLGALGLLAIGAWLISIMRKRIHIDDNRTLNNENGEFLTHDPTAIHPH